MKRIVIVIITASFAIAAVCMVGMAFSYTGSTDNNGNTTSSEYVLLDQSRLDVQIPEINLQNIDYVVDSFKDIAPDVVAIDVFSDTGQIRVLEEVVPTIVDYGYWISVTDGENTVTLDSDTVSSLSETQKDIVLSVEKATEEVLSPEQIATVGDNYAISVKLLVGTEKVSILGGKAEITVPNGFVNACIFYVADDGSKEKIESTFDITTGIIQFTVSHFSIYMVAEDSEEGGGDDDDPMMVASITIIPVLIMVAVLMLFRRSRS